MAIVKAIHYKSQYIAKSKVRYILKDGQEGVLKYDSNTILLNFTETSPDKLHLDFLKQAKYLKKRKNISKLFHYIVSFSNLDAPVSNKTMLAMAHKFLEIRKLEKNVALVKIHSNHKNNPHFHVLASSNQLEASRPQRFSKKEFKAMLRSLEEYQMKEYSLELSNSIAHINKPERIKDDYIKRDRSKRAEREYQMKLRTGKKKTQKELASEILHSILEQSSNFSELIAALKGHEDFEIYSYNDQVRGVWYKNRKYRFKTLNCSKERIKELELIADRLKQLSMIRETFKGRSRDLGLER